MASYINTNISSLNAQRNLTTSQSGLATSLQRLSTGLRINSAKDDAAGMSIASRMTSQINGNNVAARNANDGISLAQTAEGGLNSASDLLQRMRDLAVQSANGSNSDTDRASIQSEVGQLKDEIDRVAKSTSFNGLNLLDGSFTAQSFQVGANATSSDRIQIDKIANLQTTSLGTGISGATSVTGGLTTAALSAGDLTLNGTQIGATTAGNQAGQSASSAYALAQSINASAAQSGVTAKANITVATSVQTATPAAPAGTYAAVAANSFSVNGVNVGAIAKGATVAEQSVNVADAINKGSQQSGVTATVDNAGKLSLASSNGKPIVIATDSAYAGATLTADTGLKTTLNSVTGTAPTAGALAAGDLTINGTDIGAVTAGGTAAAQGTNLAAAINLQTATTGVSASADAAGKLTLKNAAGGNITIAGADLTKTGLTAAANTGNGTPGTAPTAAAAGYAAGAISINGIDLGAVSGATTAAGQGANTAAAINKLSAKTGVTAAADSVTGVLTLSAADGRDIVLKEGTTGDAKLITGIAAGTTSASVTLNSNKADGIVVGGKADKNAGLGAYEGAHAAQTTTTNSVSTVDVSTASGAQAALGVIDAALSSVNSSKAALGAYQNRFSAVVSNLQATSENLSASRSRIQDADFATETASLTRGQILQQAGTAMLAQANSLPNGVLSLLRG